ncbi:DUF6518 family protein [Streptomyces sp. NPDC005774]|uniref:DUF6518 family protein n=1 Tax=Streptomyces sp. NPDC005774 TaxID=3364728 RepID=UPI00369D2DD4
MSASRTGFHTRTGSRFRSRILASSAALTIGVVLGVLGPLLINATDPVGHPVHLVLSAGWSWAALAFCVGLARESRAESVVLAPASLVTAVIAYYLTKLGQGQYLTLDRGDPPWATPYVSWGDFASKTLLWCVVACVTGPVLGLAGNLARDRGLRGLPFRMLVPVVAVVEMSERLDVESPLQKPIVDTTWSGVRLVAVVVLVLLAGRAVMTWRLRPSAGPARK